MNNSLNAIKSMFGNMNPKQIAMNLVKQNNNPLMNNLIQMAEQGKTEELKQFGRNLFKERNLNFDDEYDKFMNNFK